MTSGATKGSRLNKSSVPFSKIVEELVNQFQHRMAVGECSASLKPDVLKEFSHFFNTGNCSPILRKEICINPTLLEFGTKQWMVHYMACPFEGYIPVPYKNLDPADVNQQNEGVIFHHCQSVLKEHVIQFRMRMGRSRFLSILVTACSSACSTTNGRICSRSLTVPTLQIILDLQISFLRLVLVWPTTPMRFCSLKLWFGKC